MKKTLIILFSFTLLLLFSVNQETHAQPDKNYGKVKLNPFKKYQPVSGRKKNPITGNGQAAGTDKKVRHKVNSKRKKSIFQKNFMLDPNSSLNRIRNNNKTSNTRKRRMNM
jgi:hypothetical protein